MDVRRFKVIVRSRCSRSNAETGKPIAGAEVAVSYPGTDPAYAPWNSNVTTAADGIARAKAAPYGGYGVLVTAKAGGYWQQDKVVPIQDVKALEPASWFGKDAHTAPLKLALYSGAAPSIELVLPAGYRGLVRVQIDPREEFAYPPGQRQFQFLVPPSGEVSATGPSFLNRVHSADITLKYADGAPLSWTAKDADVGYWWLRVEGPVETFFVGTQAEYNAQYGRVPKSDSDHKDAKSGGKGGGRGRRGR